MAADVQRKRKISADLPPDLREEDDEVIGPMPVQADDKPQKKRKGKRVAGNSKLEPL